MTKTIVTQPDIDKLNKDIEEFWQVHPATEDMTNDFEGVGRMVMFDRYSFKDLTNKTLGKGDMVVVTVKPDPLYPSRGIGIVQEVDGDNATIWVQEDYQSSLEDPEEQESGLITRTINEIDKPLELYWEQIAARVANAQANVEQEEDKKKWQDNIDEMKKECLQEK